LITELFRNVAMSFITEIKTFAALGSGVIGRPDEAKGEVPVAFVILPPAQRNESGEKAFREWCSANLSSYKRPEVRFVESLPMTDTGKVKKEQLKQIL
jgi:fatty-acyl-CoA synthase/long-chain acyl-CoA synthetase